MIKDVLILRFISSSFKKTAGSVNNSMSNEQLADELHKTIIRKLYKRKVYPSFRDNIWVLI